jgi:uncharacterized protein involved in copper resistance
MKLTKSHLQNLVKEEVSVQRQAQAVINAARSYWENKGWYGSNIKRQMIIDINDEYKGGDEVKKAATDKAGGW